MRDVKGKLPVELIPAEVLLATSEQEQLPARATRAIHHLIRFWGRIYEGKDDHELLLDAMEDIVAVLPEGWENIAEVLEYGAKKYAPRDWEAGQKFHVPYAAALRHAFKAARGELYDEESLCHHLAHVGCNILFLLTFVLRNRKDLDDRPGADLGDTEPPAPDEPAFKVGQLVRVTAIANNGKVGEVGKVRPVEPGRYSSNFFYEVRFEDGSTWDYPEHQLAPPEPEPAFKVGQLVRVSKYGGVGEVRRPHSDPHSGRIFYEVRFEDDSTWNYFEQELEPVEA